MKTSYLLVLLLALLISSTAISQDKSATIVIGLKADMTLDDSTKGPLLLVPKGNEFLDKRKPEFGQIDNLKVILYDQENPENNQEYEFSNPGDTNAFFDFNDERYRIVEKRNKWGIEKVERGPASDNNKSDFIKLKPSSAGLMFTCQNHDPKHQYSNPNSISGSCCFTLGCRTD
jgi:hypothetical protein